MSDTKLLCFSFMSEGEFLVECDVETVFPVCAPGGKLEDSRKQAEETLNGVCWPFAKKFVNQIGCMVRSGEAAPQFVATDNLEEIKGKDFDGFCFLYYIAGKYTKSVNAYLLRDAEEKTLEAFKKELEPELSNLCKASLKDYSPPITLTVIGVRRRLEGSSFLLGNDVGSFVFRQLNRHLKEAKEGAA